MSRWSRVPVLYVLVSTVAAGVLLGAADDPGQAASPRAGANDPVSLPGSASQASSASSTSPDAASPAGSAATDLVSPPESASEPGGAARPAASAAIEQRERKALGAPNHLLSARPAADKGDSGAGVLSAIDPRTNGLTRVVGSLAVVLGLALLLAKLARRTGASLGTAGRPSGVIEILARYPIARNQHLLLLKLDRRILLLHRSGVAMTMLTEVAGEDDVASLLARIEAGSRENLGTRFQGLLERFNSEHRALSAHLRGGGAGGDSDSIEMVDLTKNRSAGGRLNRKGASR